jgi:hypothetical protein
MTEVAMSRVRRLAAAREVMTGIVATGPSVCSPPVPNFFAEVMYGT